MNDLRTEIEHSINRVSAEAGSNTPDFILAEFLMGCLVAFDVATKVRDLWYGIRCSPGDIRASASVATEDAS